MPELIVRMEKRVYLEEAVLAAAHHLSDEFYVAVKVDGFDWAIILRSSTALPSDLTQRVKHTVIDEMIRVFRRQMVSFFEALDRATIGAPRAGIEHATRSRENISVGVVHAMPGN